MPLQLAAPLRKNVLAAQRWSHITTVKFFPKAGTMLTARFRIDRPAVHEKKDRITSLLAATLYSLADAIERHEHRFLNSDRCVNRERLGVPVLAPGCVKQQSRRQNKRQQRDRDQNANRPSSQPLVPIRR